ncbi:MAG: glycosyltransferase family 25 protein [Thiotrichales bacterium]|nr:glycosyltransferase family 25 protein [Thiotrichales bacterium]
MKIKAYIIHLEKSSQRARNVRKIRDRCPIPICVQAAVDGSLLTDSDLTKVYQPRLHFPDYPFPLLPGEIGVFLSHRACWKKMMDDGVDSALILEDDTVLEKLFERSLEFALNHITSLGYINFNVRPIKGRSRVVATSGRENPMQILEPALVPHRTNAQLVSRQAGEKLLISSEQFDRPVDSFLQLRRITGQRIFMMEPSGISENSGITGGSTIHNNKQISWLDRKIRRFRYRTQLRKISRQYWNSEILPSLPRQHR